MALNCHIMNEPKLYDYVMHCLDTLRYTRREVSEGSGVPFSTVNKLAQRSVREPSVHTVQAIADFFRGKEAEIQAMKEAA